MRPCFTFTARAGDKPNVLALDDEIGFWGTQARDFRAALDALDGDLVVEINSPGGDVMSGLGMYNMLRTRAAAGVNVTTRVTGVAASIASVIALAGDKREMPKNAFVMTHGVSGSVMGTESYIRDYADVVGKMNASMRGIYMDRMGVDEETANELTLKNTWLSGEECLELGFATVLTDAVEATAKFDIERADLPANVRAVFKAKAKAELKDSVVPEADNSSVAPEPEVPATPVAEQIVAEVKKAGFEAHAAFFAVSFASLDEARNRLHVAREINSLCAVVGKPEMAFQAIRSGQSLAEARTSLVNALSLTDKEVDNKQPKSNGQTDRVNAKPADVNPTALWASHNANLQLKGR